MECRLEIGHSLIVIPDPEHTPGAHQTTFSCLPVTGVSVYSLSLPRLVPYTPVSSGKGFRVQILLQAFQWW